MQNENVLLDSCQGLKPHCLPLILKEAPDPKGKGHGRRRSPRICVVLPDLEQWDVEMDGGHLTQMPQNELL